MIDDVRIKPSTHYGLQQTRVGRIYVVVLVFVIGCWDEIQIVEVHSELFLHLGEELECAVAEEVPATEVTASVTFELFERVKYINRKNMVTFLLISQLLLAPIHFFFFSHVEVEGVLGKVQRGGYREDGVQAAEYRT